MMIRTTSLLLLASATIGLAACGGGRGDGVNFTPAPPETPPPPPPMPSGPIGLVSDEPFATVSARTDGWGSLFVGAGEVEISYSAADDRYTLDLPEYSEGHLVPKSANGSYDEDGWIEIHSTLSDLTAGTGPTTQYVDVALDWPASSEFTYTSFGRWHGGLPMGENLGVFAYGIPTATGDVPLTGAATYTGEIRGVTNGVVGEEAVGTLLDVFGTVTLSFNFGAGTLAGEMDPQIAPEWDTLPLGTYTFRDTLYSPGSTTFSGAFDVPGIDASSSFSGSFTGPGAAELMAWWQAPFLYPGSTDVGSMSGVWIAKRP